MRAILLLVMSLSLFQAPVYAEKLFDFSGSGYLGYRRFPDKDDLNDGFEFGLKASKSLTDRLYLEGFVGIVPTIQGPQVTPTNDVIVSSYGIGAVYNLSDQLYASGGYFGTKFSTGFYFGAGVRFFTAPRTSTKVDSKVGSGALVSLDFTKYFGDVKQVALAPKPDGTPQYSDFRDEPEKKKPKYETLGAAPKPKTDSSVPKTGSPGSVASRPSTEAKEAVTRSDRSRPSERFRSAGKPDQNRQLAQANRSASRAGSSAQTTPAGPGVAVAAGQGAGNVIEVPLEYSVDIPLRNYRYTFETSAYSDLDRHWVRSSAEFLAGVGILEGAGRPFRPKEAVTGRDALEKLIVLSEALKEISNAQVPVTYEVKGVVKDTRQLSLNVRNLNSGKTTVLLDNIPAEDQKETFAINLMDSRTPLPEGSYIANLELTAGTVLDGKISRVFQVADKRFQVGQTGNKRLDGLPTTLKLDAAFFSEVDRLTFAKGISVGLNRPIPKMTFIVLAARMMGEFTVEEGQQISDQALLDIYRRSLGYPANYFSTFDGQKTLTRAEMATILFQIFEWYRGVISQG